MRKRKAVGELAVMEVGAKRRKTVESGGFGISYLQLRSRSLFLTPRISKNSKNSGRVRYRSSDKDWISQCSSTASSEEQREGLEIAVTNFALSKERESYDKDSTTERSTAERIMPSEEEIEELFAAAERDEKKRFADKYNYDIENDMPLDGRYEWVRL